VELGRFRGGFRDQGVELGRFRWEELDLDLTPPPWISCTLYGNTHNNVVCMINILDVK